jgi:NAD(P)H-dependent flavin oxidoreductase YrpB (nitropropane dioxygenase family)
LQSVVSEKVLRRIDILAENGNKGAQELATYWVGQGVGLMNKVKPAREVVREMIGDYLDAVERVAASLED